MEPAQKNFIITVPPIACSFPWKIHPDSLKLKELSDAWLVECCKSMPGACKSERAAFFFSPGHLINSATRLLAMLFFANAASTHLLLAIVKLMSWFFMLDNFLDDPNEMGADPVQAKRIVDSIVAVFKLPAAAESLQQIQGEDEGILQSLMDSAQEWWEDLCLYMTPSQQARFSALFVEYVQSNHAEVCVRASPHPPAHLQTYMRIRSASIGWYPLPVLTECCLGIELDAEVLTHPLLISLKQNVCENIILVNDIVSFGKEYMQGDLFNVVFVLCFNKLLTHDPSCDLTKGKALLSKEMLQEGVLQVSEMIKERDTECVRIMEEIRRSPFLMSKPCMEAYIQGLGLFLGGNLYWHLVSARYGLSTPPASAPTPNHIMQVPNLLIPHELQLSCLG